MTPGLFLTAGILNVIAGLLHLWVIYKGPDGYRLMGAGERMARMAEQGRLYPHLLTIAIAGALCFFGYLCFSQAHLVPSPPYARETLWLLTGVYIIRGLYPLCLKRWVPLFQSRFFIVSSLIVLGYGFIHLAALGT